MQYHYYLTYIYLNRKSISKWRLHIKEKQEDYQLKNSSSQQTHIAQ